jgi:hypothetical protein
MCQLSWNLGASDSWNRQVLYKDCFTFYLRFSLLAPLNYSLGRPLVRVTGRAKASYLISLGKKIRMSKDDHIWLKLYVAAETSILDTTRTVLHICGAKLFHFVKGRWEEPGTELPLHYQTFMSSLSLCLFEKVVLFPTIFSSFDITFDTFVDAVTRQHFPISWHPCWRITPYFKERALKKVWS